MSTENVKVDIKKCVVSIDVGVLNLAICVLGISETNEADILMWNLYNVTKVAAEKKKAPTKKEKELFKPCINVVRKTGQSCGKLGPVNSRGRAYCGVHDPKKKHNAEDTQNWTFDLMQALPDIGKEIADCVPSHLISRDSFSVIIEQQSMDNKKILLQSHLIYGFFVQLYSNSIDVKFVPAYNKLTVYSGPEIACTLKTPYAKRKFLAKKHTEHFLEIEKSLQKWKAFYDGCGAKRDDLSDAFLQGLHSFRGSVARQVSGADGKPSGKVVRKRRKKVRF